MDPVEASMQIVVLKEAEIRDLHARMQQMAIELQRAQHHTAGTKLRLDACGWGPNPRWRRVPAP